MRDARCERSIIALEPPKERVPVGMLIQHFKPDSVSPVPRISSQRLSVLRPPDVLPVEGI